MIKIITPLIIVCVFAMTSCKTDSNQNLEDHSTTTMESVKSSSDDVEAEMSDKEIMVKEEMTDKDMTDKDGMSDKELMAKKEMEDKDANLPAVEESSNTTNSTKTNQTKEVQSSISTKANEVKSKVETAPTPSKPSVDQAPVATAPVVKKTTSTPAVPKVVPPPPPPAPVASTPDHTAWDQLTKKYVSSAGKVNYGGFKGELAKLETYLSHLENTPPTSDWSKNEKLAYWFNLYNAATIHKVSSSYPINSITDLNGGKPWDNKFVKSGNKTYSLNEIENVVVRPNFNEPRLHVAFNCAAISCPKLANEAFTASKLNGQLNRLSKAWINDSSKNKLSENDIQVSQIFDWYGVDFKGGIIAFINSHSSSTKVSESATVSYLEYDWSLND